MGLLYGKVGEGRGRENEQWGRNLWEVGCVGTRTKVSGRKPFYTKTHLKHFKILYLPRNFIKPKSELLIDFYFN